MAIENGRIIPISFFSFLFFHFLSLFGFKNPVNSSRVSIQAQKMLYCGYLNGYNQNHALEVIDTWQDNPKPCLDFLKHVSSSRTDINSKRLQDMLVSFFNGHQYDFPVAVKGQNHRFKCFGDTYYSHQLYQQLPLIDVQNQTIIKNSLSRIDSVEGTLPSSNFRHTWVTDKLDRMLTCYQSSSIKGVDLDGHIENHQLVQKLYQTFPRLLNKYYHLSISILKKMICCSQEGSKRSQYYQEILSLIEQFARPEQQTLLLDEHFLDINAVDALDTNNVLVKSWVQGFYQKYKQSKTSWIPSMKSWDVALYIIAHLGADFVEQQDLEAVIHALIKHYAFNTASTLLLELYSYQKEKAVAIFRKHCDDLKAFLPKDNPIIIDYGNAVSRPSTFQKFFSNTPLREHQRALELDPNFKYRAGANEVLKQLIADRKFEEAVQLFKERIAMQLSSEEIEINTRKQLSTYLLDCTKSALSRSKALMMSDKIEALQTAVHSQEHLMDALQIAPMNFVSKALEYTFRVQVTEQIFQLNNCSFEMLEQAYDMILTFELNKVKVSEAPDLYQAITYFLMRYIDELQAKCLHKGGWQVPMATQEHAGVASLFASKLILVIDKLFTTNELSKQVDNKKLAYYAFLKADTLDFFQLGDATGPITLATKLDSAQPYFWLRASEIKFDDKLSNEQGLSLLPKSGKSASDYWNWREERWIPLSDRIFKEFIPESVSEPEPPSFLGRIFSGRP